MLIIFDGMVFWNGKYHSEFWRMILVDRARVLIVVLSVVGKIPLGLLFRSVACERLFLPRINAVCVVTVCQR